jgi:phospholipase/carboxylesterase
VPIDDAAALWSRPDGERVGRPLVVLLHGYGGRADDMSRLFARVPDSCTAVALRAPHPLRSGFTWFHVPEHATDPSAAHVSPAADALLAWIAAHRRSAPSVGVVGYSQGGAVAIHALRRDPDAIDSVVTLAGFLGVGSERGDDDLTRRRPPVFWGHGDRDDVILPQDIARMESFLPAHSSLTRRTYPDLDHSISDEEASDVAAFLSAIVEGAGPRRSAPAG